MAQRDPPQRIAPRDNIAARRKCLAARIPALPLTSAPDVRAPNPALYDRPMRNMRVPGLANDARLGRFRLDDRFLAVDDWR